MLILAVMLAACTTSPNAPDIIDVAAASRADTVSASTKITPDPRAGWTRVIAPAVLVDNRLYGRRYVLNGWIEPSGPASKDEFQLQLSAGFPKRVYLKEAYAEGRKLKTTVIDRERIDCGYECTVLETVGVDLSESEIQSFAESGLALEVIGRRATILIDIPPAYFRSFLDRYRQQRARG